MFIKFLTLIAGEDTFLSVALPSPIGHSVVFLASEAF